MLMKLHGKTSEGEHQAPSLGRTQEEFDRADKGMVARDLVSPSVSYTQLLNPEFLILA